MHCGKSHARLSDTDYLGDGKREISDLSVREKGPQRQESYRSKSERSVVISEVTTAVTRNVETDVYSHSKDEYGPCDQNGGSDDDIFTVIFWSDLVRGPGAIRVR